MLRLTIGFPYLKIVVVQSPEAKHATTVKFTAGNRSMPIIIDTLRATFRPEFLNRIDEVVIFRGLTTALLRGIVELP